MYSTIYQFWKAQHLIWLPTNSTMKCSRPLRKLLQQQQEQILADTKKPGMMKTKEAKKGHEKQREEMNQIQRRSTLESIQKGMK